MRAAFGFMAWYLTNHGDKFAYIKLVLMSFHVFKWKLINFLPDINSVPHDWNQKKVLRISDNLQLLNDSNLIAMC